MKHKRSSKSYTTPSQRSLEVKTHEAEPSFDMFRKYVFLATHTKRHGSIRSKQLFPVNEWSDPVVPETISSREGEVNT